jgi:hypothetical protein
LAGIGYPNGQNTAFSYFGNSFDERLQEIKNVNSTGAVISQQDYTYNSVGDILTWQQQTDGSPPLLWTDSYDAADQLTGAVETNTYIPSPAIMQNTYTYDAAGNPAAEQIGTVSRASSYNALNQLTRVLPGAAATPAEKLLLLRRVVQRAWRDAACRSDQGRHRAIPALDTPLPQ